MGGCLLGDNFPFRGYHSRQMFNSELGFEKADNKQEGGKPTIHVTKHQKKVSKVNYKSPASRLFTQPFILGADQKKHQSSTPLAFVRGIHRWPVNSPHKGPVTWKIFHLMTSSSFWTFVTPYLKKTHNAERIWSLFNVQQIVATPRASFSSKG